MQINEDNLYSQQVGMISVYINCLVKEKNLIEMKNDLIEEWCIAVDYLFNWLLLYVFVNECLRQVK